MRWATVRLGSEELQREPCCSLTGQSGHDGLKDGGSAPRGFEDERAEEHPGFRDADSSR